MKKTLLLWLWLLPLGLGAQSTLMRRATQAMQELDYQTAIQQFLLVLEKEDNAEAKANLAECYRKINDTENAELWYGQLVRLPYPKPVYKLYYGMMLQANSKCNLAINWFKQYEKEAPDDARAKNLAAACDREQELRNKNQDVYQVFPLPINSAYDDFGPSILGNQLVFASDRDLGKPVKRTSMWTGNPFSDLYSAPLKSDQPGALEAAVVDGFSPDINTEFNEAAACVSPDGQQLFFTRNNYLEGNTSRSDEGLVKLNLFTARRNERGGWSDISRLPFNTPDFNTAHPCLSPDGKRLYFSSNRPGGFGGMDLYYCDWQNGGWGNALNLGPTINTEGNEIFPFVDGNGRLYFAGNGHLGLGGLDLFYSTPKGDKDWNVPVNLGAPVNSNRDDFGIWFGGDLTWGFFTSNREGGAGRDDIYAFSRNASTLEIYVFDTQTNKPISGATVLNSLTGFSITTSADGIAAFDMRQEECADFSTAKKGYEMSLANGCAGRENGQTSRVEIGLNKVSNYSVQGIVFDMRDGFPALGARVILSNDCGKTASQPIITGPDGRFRFKLDKNCCYTLRAESEGFIAGVAEGICTKNSSSNTTNRVNLNLEPYRDREGFIVDIPERSTQTAGPRYNLQTGLYENADGSLASFELGEGLSVREGVLYDNGAPSKPEESAWERSQDGYLVKLYYDLNGIEPNDASMPELWKLLKTLHQNPDMQVEIGSHTDARGSDDYNLELSQQRAEAVVSWLVKQGITFNRLLPKGYGETRLVNRCGNGVDCDENLHQLNRRTEFRVIRKKTGN
ncbi:MAG: PD40 domain-containing protein [Chitinophagales bacterium]|nr:PD40 domain-containing protein [Chitinophagales bacterium]